MRLPAAALTCLSCLCLATPALAAGEGALDLSLPQAGQTRYGGDPPGTYYGDTSGVPVAPRDTAPAVRRTACPTSPDGEENAVTGSVSTGFGHSRLGNSRFNAASVNYCREYATDDGDSRTINLQLNVGEYDGPGYGPVYGPGYGPGPYGPGPYGPRPGFGPGPWPAARGGR